MIEKKVILNTIDITSLLKAENSLIAVLAQPKTEFIRDAAIQRFECTFELAWKTLKRILREQGLVANSPREVFRLAAQVSLIDDPKQWFAFLDDRNRTTHIYNENIANEIYAHLKIFQQHLTALMNKIRQL
jgi:nucleotidyltransferase substrate binding protein (TIGR01987 family)